MTSGVSAEALKTDGGGLHHTSIFFSIKFKVKNIVSKPVDIQPDMCIIEVSNLTNIKFDTILRKEGYPTMKNTNTNRTFGYARISRKSQNIDRQISNITSVYPDALIIREAYTGTKLEGRKEFEKLIRTVRPGDRIIFDSVSRMSRNAEEGIRLYKELYNNGVELVFMKEPQINTETYKREIEKEIGTVTTGDQDADELVNTILKALTRYTMRLAEKQIRIAFDQAEKEVTDLQQRTREGIREVKRHNELIRAGLEDGEEKQIGQRTGAKLNVKKSVTVKAQIIKLSKDFDGTNTDTEVMKLTGVARNTYYKYKREISEGIITSEDVDSYR